MGDESVFIIIGVVSFVLTCCLPILCIVCFACLGLKAVNDANNNQQNQNVYVPHGASPTNNQYVPNAQPVNGTFGAGASGQPL